MSGGTAPPRAHQNVDEQRGTSPIGLLETSGRRCMRGSRWPGAVRYRSERPCPRPGPTRSGGLRHAELVGYRSQRVRRDEGACSASPAARRRFRNKVRNDAESPKGLHESGRRVVKGLTHCGAPVPKVGLLDFERPVERGRPRLAAAERVRHRSERAGLPVGLTRSEGARGRRLGEVPVPKRRPLQNGGPKASKDEPRDGRTLAMGVTSGQQTHAEEGSAKTAMIGGAPVRSLCSMCRSDAINRGPGRQIGARHRSERAIPGVGPTRHESAWGGRNG